MVKKSECSYYEMLYEVAVAVNSARTPEGVLRSAIKNVAGAVGAKGCSLLLLTPDGKRLLHTATCGLSDGYVRKGPISVDKSIAEALAGKPVAVLDATTDKRVQYREQKKKEGIVSILSVPIMLRGKAIGVIRVYTAEPRQFTRDDIYFVSAVANLGAIALENAQLYNLVQKDYETVRQDMLTCRATLADEWIGQEPGVVAHRWWKFM